MKFRYELYHRYSDSQGRRISLSIIIKIVFLWLIHWFEVIVNLHRNVSYAIVINVFMNNDLLHKSLVNNEKVVQIVKNAKNLTTSDVPDIDLITADLSFISAKQVLDVFYRILPKNGNVILLIKPQFEMDEKRNFKNGIIKDEKLRRNACSGVFDAASKTGFFATDMTVAPINKDKNVEFLLLLSKNAEKGRSFESLYKF